MKLTGKQERFCLNVFSGMRQHEAYLKAGYSANQLPAVIDVNATRLIRNPNCVLRLAELQSKAKSAKIMTVTERKERLTEIAQARLTDYQTSDGITVDKASLNTGAIESLEVSTRRLRDSNTGSATIKRAVIPEALRDSVFERDGHVCRECGSTSDLQIDHIVPLSRGGSTVEGNLQALCEGCNKRKAGGQKSQERITRLKLHSPIAAIQELNRMEMIGTPRESVNQAINVVFMIGRGYQDEGQREAERIGPVENAENEGKA